MLKKLVNFIELFQFSVTPASSRYTILYTHVCEKLHNASIDERSLKISISDRSYRYRGMQYCLLGVEHRIAKHSI